MKRVVSLDILRGMTILGMILVNSPGVTQTPAFLIHSSWDGCTFADLVFPFFIFIVGASMFYAFGKSNFELNKSVALKIIKRSILIFAIGYFLNSLWFDRPLGEIRIMAALQRIAIVYLVASFLVLWVKRPRVIAGITVLLLLGYWALIHFTNSYLPENNFIAQLDSAILGQGRMYYIAGHLFDPEGVVGNIAALCSALIGFLVASVISKLNKWQMLAIGCAMASLALVWDMILPLNKPLWSSSFVLWTCGLATMLWAGLYWVVDVKGWAKWGTFFRVFGSNAIFAYVLSELVCSFCWQWPGFQLHGWMYENVISGFASGWEASIVWSLMVVFFTWIATYVLYKKKIFLKI